MPTDSIHSSLETSSGFAAPPPETANESLFAYPGLEYPARSVGTPVQRAYDQKVVLLKQTLENHRGDRHLILLQDFPDPDALSCAWAYKLICETYDIDCEIIYAGTLSHQENIALVRLTGLPVQRWTMPDARTKQLSAYQGYVLIDNQGTTSQLLALMREAGLPAIAVIDHHSPQSKLDAEFIDIRPNARATTVIFAQYLQAGLLPFDGGNNQHTN